MVLDRRELFGTALAAGLAAATGASAQQKDDAPTPAAGDPNAPFWPSRERYPLWPKNPPGAPRQLPVLNPTMNGPQGARELWLRGIASPEIQVYRSARPDGSALLAFPGGGYEFLSVQNEGLDVAERFNAERATVFVLTYRLPAEGWANRHLVPLQDAQRAMRLIRSRAADFRIDPARLGVIGFSAGGHLAADLATAYAERTYAPVDEADGLPARPAFAALIYAVTTLRPSEGHRGSLDHLLGPDPATSLIDARSPLLHVDAQTPPCFLVHAIDDGTVPLANSLDWLAACRAAKVPVEGHFFTEGGHGFGLHLPRDRSGSRWPDFLALWMRRHNG
ncbi:MAG TPA: alpha/beta hydrolase [Allosphingosinicella sp.]|jgi:acetyl esterase/lipase|nr:alpha/beta hydrolase [Allosphingosinicella sp.]